MKQIVELIKQKIADCEKKGNMFNMPAVDRKDVQVSKKDLESTGSSLYHCEYNVKFENGDWIHIDYQSKDKCRTFQINPDRSLIEVTCSDPSLNFSDAWDEGLSGR